MKRIALFFIVGALGMLACTRSTPPKPEVKLPEYARFEFKDENGKNFKLASLKGQPLLVSFIFTRCPVPDMCPLTMQLNQRLAKKTKEAGLNLKFLIVTIDPAFDTPAVMKKYGDRYDLDRNQFILATGEDQAISDFASELANVIGFPSGNLISHNVKTVLLNPNLEIAKEFKDNEWTPSDVFKTVQKLG